MEKRILVYKPILFALLVMGFLLPAAAEDILPLPQEAVPAADPGVADVTFKKKNKMFATLTLADKKEGLSIVFNSDKLDKGRYELKILDSCGKSGKKSKGRSIKLGDFTTVSGYISSEFLKKDLSLNESLESVADKVVSLHKVPKKGESSQVACAEITKKNQVATEFTESSSIDSSL